MIKRELCWTVCFRETSTPCVCSSRLKLMVWSYRLCFLCLVFVAILSFFFTLLCWKLSVLSSKYIEYTSTHLTRGRFKRNHSHLQAYYQSLNSPKQQSFELHQETQLPFSLWHWSVWLFHKSKCSPSLKWMTTIFAVMTMEMEAGSFFRIALLLYWSPQNQQARIGVTNSSPKAHIHAHFHPREGPSLQSPTRAPPVIIMIVFLPPPHVTMHLPHSKQGLTLLLN